MTTISDGVTSVTPTLVDGYSASRAARNVLHTALDGTEDVSLMPTAPRSGVLRAVFSDEADAWSLVGMLSEPGVFTVASALAVIDMSFTTDGEIAVGLDDETRSVWIVEFGFREMSS